MQNFKLTYLIDDDQIFVFVLKKLLQKSQRFDNVETIINGLEAIEILKSAYDSPEGLPDIIFLDLNMPVLDGWQFLDEVEKLPFKDQLKIYIISSSIDSKEIEKAKEYKSVKSFVSKPVNLEWLLNIK